MSLIPILLTTKGHPFEKGPFFQLFDSLEGIDYTHIEHPAAQLILNPLGTNDYSVLVFYDMPGINFEGDKPGQEIPPSEEFKKGFNKLVELGKPMLFLHHSIASWPNWDKYGEIIGGRFLYRSKEIRGKIKPDSGYRHEVKYTAKVIKEHPITKGLSEFPMCDELYLAEVFEDSITPLVESDYGFTHENFYSATQAIEGKMYNNKNWLHDNGSPCIAWIKNYQNSPIVYLQMGDSPDTYENSSYRLLVKNSLTWLNSNEAKLWAKGD